MGVFVVYGLIGKFIFVCKDEVVWELVLKDIEDLIEVVKWVNVIWVMVVFGNVDEIGCDWFVMGY